MPCKSSHLSARTSAVKHALGLASASAGVEQEQRVLSLHPLNLGGVRLLGDAVCPPVLPACLHGGVRSHLGVLVLQDEHVLGLHTGMARV